MGKFQDLTGKIFGFLLVLEYVSKLEHFGEQGFVKIIMEIMNRVICVGQLQHNNAAINVVIFLLNTNAATIYLNLLNRLDTIPRRHICRN